MMGSRRAAARTPIAMQRLTWLRRAALAFSALVLVATGCDDPAPIERAEGASEEAQAAARLGPFELAATESNGASDGETSARNARSAALVDEVVAAEGAASANADELVVRVVDENGAPVPEATVYVFEPRLGEEAHVLFERNIGLDTQTFLERRGETRVADATGTLRMARLERNGLVGASTPGRWGAIDVEARAGEATIALAPTQELFVRVVGADGAVRVAVPVALHRERRGEVRDVRIVETGGDGLARFGHPTELFERGDREWQWRVALAVPLFEPSFALLDPAALPSEPVELVLPPTARVVVELFEATGEPLTSSGRFTAATAGERGRAPFERHLAGEARVVLQHVEPGVSLDLGFQREGSPGRHTLRASAPLVPDVESVVRFALAPDHPVVTLRLVDDEDAPLAARRVEFRLVDAAGSTPPQGGGRRGRDGGRDTGERFATTDAEGLLVVDLPSDWAGRPAPLSGSVATLVTPPASAPPFAGVFTVPAPLLMGVNDLGKVRLSPPPVLVAGAVVDELGLPVADVEIALHLRTVDAEGREQWPRLPDLGATSDELGRFEIAAWSPGSPLALRANTRDHVRADLVPFDPGAKNVIVTLLRAGRVEGSMRLPEGVDARRFEVGLAPAGVEPTRDALGRASVARTSSRRGDGTFELSRVPPGSYTFWLAYTELPTVLFVAGDVLVRSAETTHDARLDPIDVTRLLDVFDLRFLEADGDPVGSASGRWRVSGSEAWRGFEVDGEGRTRIVADGGILDLDVISRGFAPTRFEGVSSSGDLTLDPALDVSVRIDRDVLPDPERYRTSVVLEPVGWGGGRTTAELDADGQGRFMSAGPGTYTVRFVVQRRQGGGRRAERTVADDPPETVTFDVRDGEILIRPKVPREKLAAAVAALG
jgi:protocatechuate 3,4-dioxygenase beta subunit